LLPAIDATAAKCPRCARALPAGTDKLCVYCGATLAPAGPPPAPSGSRSPSRAAHDPLIGETVAGRFRIEELIGQGGMGKVYRARHLALDRLVCLKMLRPALLEDPTVVGRFEREAMAASRLNHPNSIQVLDFGRNASDGALYIAMEYVQGKDLRELLRDEWPIPEDRLCRIVSQVLAALAEAHAHNVIHRDLKPENIMLEQRRNHPDFVKVLDFGIAKVLDSELPGLTRSDVVCGTPQYMAPEQATGAQLDARCDLYAVGIILYQMATAQLPFDGPNAMDVLTRQVNELPVPPRKREPRAPISAAMEALILRVLAKDPAARPQSAEVFRQLLLAVPGGGVTPGFDAAATPARGTAPLIRARTTPLRQPAKGPSWQRRGAALASACVLAALVAGAAYRQLRAPKAAAIPASYSNTVNGRDPARAQQLVRRAAQLESSSDSRPALDLLLQAVEADPENAEAHFRLGGLFLKSEPERARTEYAAAKRLDRAKYGDVVDTILKGI
jgi:tRNA A-37 threonylcarbamoyl transferase component Bud32